MTVDLEPVQLVAPDGTPTAECRYSRDLPAETLCWLYEMMVVTRELDAEFVNLKRQGELALFASCRGQEAAQVGATACLRKTDWLFPQYRELGAFLVRGIPPGHVGAAWRGTWHGGLDFTKKCCAPMSIPIGTQTLHAVGAAMAAQRLGEDSVTVAFLGDGATSEGDVHEALNFAAVFNAPCVFYVQNNQWAISVPISKQTAAPSIAHKAIGYGMPGVRVDGNDVLACYAVMAEAAARARAGGGPTLIEAVTYRLGPHTTSDDPSRYRTQEEVDRWAGAGPDSALPHVLARPGTVVGTPGGPGRRPVEANAGRTARRGVRRARHRHRRSLHHGVRRNHARIAGAAPTAARRTGPNRLRRRDDPAR